MSRLLNAPFLLLVHTYRLLVSPLKPRTCRFHPTCSQYALEALRLHPLPRALGLIVRRVSRCHPWGGSGEDPVPRPEDRGET